MLNAERGACLDYTNKNNGISIFQVRDAEDTTIIKRKPIYASCLANLTQISALSFVM